MGSVQIATGNGVMVSLLECASLLTYERGRSDEVCRSLEDSTMTTMMRREQETPGVIIPRASHYLVNESPWE